MKTGPTQGALICAEAKRRALTYAEMQRVGRSLSPQKRVREWLDLHPEWDLRKLKRHFPDGQTLVAWKIVKRGA